MSNLSSETERKAIEELSKCLKHFDNLADLNMTAFNAEASIVAENVIKDRVSHRNGTTSIKKG